MKRPLKITVLAPIANPHLLSVFREMQRSDTATLHLFAFRDFPQHRLDLGWKTPEDVQRVSLNPLTWCRLFVSIFCSDAVVLQGLVDPFPGQTLAAVLVRVVKGKLWLASEGFKNRDRRLPLPMRMIFNSASTQILAIGDGAAEDYRSAGLVRSQFFRFGFAEKYYVSQNATSFENETSDRDNDWIRVLAVGQLNSRKNFDSIIAAFSMMKTERRVRLTVCGEGDNRSQLRRSASDLPENFSVSLLGNCDSKELDREFRQADIFVMPSIYDGWGVVLNQAVAYHLPVVVSSGVRAARGHLVRDGESGFIYEDQAELTDRLCRLIEDDQLRKAFSMQAATLSELWSVQSIAQRLYQVMSGQDSFQEGPLEAL